MHRCLFLLINLTMKKIKYHVFFIFNKAQIIFLIISFALAFSSSLSLDIICSAKTVNSEKSLDFSVVIDAGHGGLDVK